MQIKTLCLNCKQQVTIEAIVINQTEKVTLFEGNCPLCHKKLKAWTVDMFKKIKKNKK